MNDAGTEIAHSFIAVVAILVICLIATAMALRKHEPPFLKEKLKMLAVVNHSLIIGSMAIELGPLALAVLVIALSAFSHD